jgi:tetratricopeptide (TPR) repeat protein
MLRFVSGRALALALLVLAAGCQPHGPDALRRGDELLRAGRVAEAVPLLERAATDLPDDPRAWNFLGLAYHDANRPEEAQKAYLRALRADRNYFDVHYNLGALHSEQGNWAEAERSLRTFLAPDANRNHAAAWALLGDAQLRLRKLDDAERSLAFAAKLAPNSADVWNNLGLVYAGKRRWPAARQDFAYAIRLDPRNAAARLNLAVAAQQAGDRRAALPLYRDYLAVAPNAANAEDIRSLIRQLDAQLNGTGTAAAAAPTNSVAAARPVTNVPTAAVTRAPAPTNAAPAKVTPPATRPVADTRPAAPKRSDPATGNPGANASAPKPTAAKAETPKPAAEETAALPATEVVRVNDGPTLRAARDVVASTPAAPTAPVTTPTPADPAPAAVTPATGETAPTAAPTRTARTEPAKRKNLWQRANPVNWFRDGSAPPPRAGVPPATLPLPDGSPAAQPAVPVAAPKPKPVKPAVARYASRSPADLPAGNRAEADAQFAAAVAAHDRRDFANAIALYQRAVELDPSHFSAHYNLGLAALDAGDVSRALLAGECATRLNPRSTTALRLFASALQRGNYPADAAEQLERVVAAEPADAGAHLALGGLYARSLGEPEKARPHYERALALDPQNSQAGAIRLWLAENP